MFRLAFLTLVAAATCQPAWAKSSDPRLTAALACTTIADSGQRLACYDAAVSTLREAVEAGTLVGQQTIGDPTALEGVIAASGGRGYNRFWVRLDNGDRWEIFANSSTEELPKAGAKVKLKKSPAGGYWFDEPGVPARKARFIGRSTG